MNGKTAVNNRSHKGRIKLNHFGIAISKSSPTRLSIWVDPYFPI